MARLFTSGFELQTAANEGEWYTSDATIPSAPTINTNATHVRSGDASLRVQNPTAAQAKCVVTRFQPVSDGIELFFRIYIKIATAPDSETSFVGLGTSHNANVMRVVLTPSRTLKILLDVGSSLETFVGSTVLTTGQWYRIEGRLVRNETLPNSGRDSAELRIDGQPEIAVSNASIITTPSRFVAGGNLNDENCSTCDFYLDDAALNSSSGTNQASWPGEGRVVALRPNAEGEFAQSVTKAGSAPTASNWGSLNDLPVGAADDEDFLTFTTAASNWTGSGSRVAVGLTSMPASPGSIKFVVAGARLRNQSTTSVSTLGVSFQTANGGAKATDQTLQFIHESAWQLNTFHAYRATIPTPQFTQPDGSPWTESSVNSLQLLLRGDDVTPNFSLTAAWVTVEYADADAGPGSPAPSGAGRLLLLGVG